MASMDRINSSKWRLFVAFLALFPLVTEGFSVVTQSVQKDSPPSLKAATNTEQTFKVSESYLFPSSQMKRRESPALEGIMDQGTKSNTFVMSVAGVAFSFFVIYAIAMKPDPMSFFSLPALEGAAENVLDISLPSSLTEFVTVPIAEALSGVTGALASFGLSQIMMSIMSKKTVDPNNESDVDLIANSDFFLAQAGVFPLISLVGMSSTETAVASALFATIPYELVRLSSRQQRWRQEEDRIMEQLLQREKEKEEKQRSNYLARWKLQPQRFEPVVDLGALIPINDQREALGVEIFSDLLKWLSYAVLNGELGGKILFGNMVLSDYPGAEGSFFGILCGVSVQVYSDILYALFGWGGEAKKEEVLSRTQAEWSGLLLSRALATGTLFGVYETTQLPIQDWVSVLLSGGVGNCFGSDNYELCSEIFQVDNPPPMENSLEAVQALLNYYLGASQQP